MKTDGMHRVLATHWEAEEYTECWCLDLATAQRIANALALYDSMGETTVQVDAPLVSTHKQESSK